MQANIDTPQQRSNRWWILVGLVIIVAALAAVFFTVPHDVAGIKRPFRSFSFPSTSMEPTLRIGERAFADMRAYNDAPPARGDIVVFTLPRDPATTYVKRVVGLPGEQVQMKNGIVYINGQGCRQWMRALTSSLRMASRKSPGGSSARRCPTA